MRLMKQMVDFESKDVGNIAKSADLGLLPEWDLTDLYESPDDVHFSDDMSRAERDVAIFVSKYKGNLKDLALTDIVELAAAVKAFESLVDLLGRMMSYAYLRYAGDTRDPVNAKFYGDVNEKITTISSSLIGFELELNAIDDATMEHAASHPDLVHYRPWLNDIRKERPYQLDDRIECLFHEKSVTSNSAWNRLFDETIADLRFGVDGEQLPIEPMLNRLLNPDEDIRRMASQALANTFKKNVRLFTHITNTLAKDKAISDKWRGFASVTDSRHLANRVERRVVDALEHAVVASYPRLSHRYYALKAKWMGKDRLAHWDRNAPLPNQSMLNVPWEEARRIVLQAYHNFSPEMSELAEHFFEKKWIDAPARAGKTPGAFAHPTVPSVHPYVLINYQGKRRDVMTLAHELGHGVHQLLAAQRGSLMSPTPLTLAETASVFGEMLTFRYLLDNASDERDKRLLRAQKVEDMLNTVVRQIAFYRFEQRVHKERAHGELLPEQIEMIWKETQGESLGPAIEMKDGYETFWSYVPHFIHSPFYVYAYAFGDCLVNSLFAIYESNATGFQENYFDMLRAGGSKSYGELLGSFGLDIEDSSFWSMGLEMIERMIDELE